MIKKVTISSIIISLLLLQSIYSQQQELKIIDVARLEQIMLPEEGKLKIINFWATWCKPCIKELPYFVQAQKSFPEVEFIFISLDFAEKAPQVQKFAEKRGLDKGELYLIDDLDYNSWIDKVSPEWSGAIPGTLIVGKEGKKFYEKEFHAGELQELIKIEKNKL